MLLDILNLNVHPFFLRLHSSPSQLQDVEADMAMSLSQMPGPQSSSEIWDQEEVNNALDLRQS